MNLRGLMFVFALVFAASMGLWACGDEDSKCDEAWDVWCACPGVTCDGEPSSCTGPDLEWAECVLDATDACSANCL